MKAYFAFVVLGLIACSVTCGDALALIPNICNQPVDGGTALKGGKPCLQKNTLFMRYAFDVSKRQCISFTFYGCGGNSNNFGTRNECQYTCKLK